ncbi:hypothetical protein SAMN02745166_04095 [Prosthecobacter debontii]|uniref:Uncharacterized protein n=1 Tax=Prosthecobacter debontii TaxID=48467 RepID=A0A1T4YSQ2_9BACT|nr:hypothetical protein [Prosthecobacter debontii]SKB04760.1 hypothetical protein SAMN02745166_04095 [Prosthecobacter debontii]
MRDLALSLALFFYVSASAVGQTLGEPQIYYDESGKRYATLSSGDFGSNRITIRLAGDPGSLNEWRGQGQRQGKEMAFARIVGEGESPGTFFVAKITDSRLEIDYKPQQKAPQDAGINGSYRRVNESKLLQLAKKEFQAADERLQASLKNAAKVWDRRDRPALDLWKELWPGLRQRWIALSPSNLGAAKAGSTSEKNSADWVWAAQATARGYYFVETQPDAKTALGWEGEYDDLGGGHASLRLGADGKLRLNLASFRIEGDEATTVEATAAAADLTEEKNGRLTAKFTLPATEQTTGDQQPQITLTKIGRYLVVETDHAEKLTPRGWFDGIYRGAPVPPAP